MLVKNKDMLVLSVVLQKSKKTNEPYLMIKLLDGDDGSEYSIIEKSNLDLVTKIKPMEKWKCNLLFHGDKFGVHLTVKDFIEKVGQV